MSTLHNRLREERVRIGLPQYSLAALGGVKPNAQVKYENGNRLPRGDYLSAIALAGVDLLFIITGQRSIGISQLTGDERAFISAFRLVTGSDKTLVSQLVFRLDGHLDHDGVETRTPMLPDGIDGLSLIHS
jgi:transcriptional regulator with XRE-family HTH domain